jgi:acyl carrier protein
MQITLESELRDLVAMLLDVDPGQVSEGDSFAGLGVDSLMRLEIVAFVEHRIGRQVPEEQLPNLANIREVVSYVQSLG